MIQRDTRAEIQQGFRLFDIDKTGSITFDNLKHIAVKILGYDVTDEELKEMLVHARSSGEEHDREEEVSLTFEDFAHVQRRGGV